MYRYNILDFRYLNYIVTLLLVGVAVLTGLLMWRKKARVFTALLLVFHSLLLQLEYMECKKLLSFRHD